MARKAFNRIPTKKNRRFEGRTYFPDLARSKLDEIEAVHDVLRDKRVDLTHRWEPDSEAEREAGNRMSAIAAGRIIVRAKTGETRAKSLCKKNEQF